MARRTRTPTNTFFDHHSEPLDQRIATGLHKIGLALKLQSWQRASGAGLSPAQGQILAVLAADGAMTATEVARRLGVKLPTVSESVRVLVDKGLLERSADPRHGRAQLLTLTEGGRSRALEARAWPEFLAGAAGSLSDAERAAFWTGLIKMIRTLQEQGQIPTHRMCVTCVHFRPHVNAGARPHHCAFVDAPMAPSHLRLDCDDHIAADEAGRAATWAAFLAPQPQGGPLS